MIINNKLQIPTNKGKEYIDLSSIIHIEAISNYSKIYLAQPQLCKNEEKLYGNTIVVAKVLKWFDDHLKDNGFVRIHRSHLINKDSIKNIINKKVQLNNLEWVNISRRKNKPALFN